MPTQTSKTIRIAHPIVPGNDLGYIVINEEDKTDEQQLYVEPSAKVAEVVLPIVEAQVSSPLVPPVVPPVVPSWAQSK